MNIRAKSDVIGEIPANVVWVFIDNDLIGIPQPVAAVPNVVGRHAEEEPPKPETSRTASFKVLDTARTESASEVSVLPRVIEMVVRITTARVMSGPSAVGVDVRSIRVTWLIAKIAVFLSRMRIASKGSRAVGRGWMALLFPSLRQGWKRKKQKSREKTDRLVHEVSPWQSDQDRVRLQPET